MPNKKRQKIFHTQSFGKETAEREWNSLMDIFKPAEAHTQTTHAPQALREAHLDALNYYIQSNPTAQNKHMGEVEDLFKKIFHNRERLVNPRTARNVNYKLMELWFCFFQEHHLSLSDQLSSMDTFFNQLRWNYLNTVRCIDTQLCQESFLIDSPLDILKASDDINKLIVVLKKITDSNLYQNYSRRFNQQWVTHVFPKLIQSTQLSEHSKSTLNTLQQQVSAKYLYTTGPKPNIKKVLQWAQLSLDYDQKNQQTLHAQVKDILTQDTQMFQPKIQLPMRTMPEAQTVLTIDPDHCKANLALLSSQHTRITTMFNTAVKHTSQVRQDLFHNLSKPWSDLVSTLKKSQVIETLERYYAIDTSDPLKSAMETIHGKEHIIQLICASAVAGKYCTQVCLGDLDVTVDNSGFHTLIQQYSTIIQLQQANNRYAFNFLIGPPGHHCHTKAAGFCYSNAGALSVLGTAPTEFCYIIGLDINPDDGLHKTLKRLTSSESWNQGSIIRHDDIYASNVYPQVCMQGFSSPQYHYNPIDVAEGKKPIKNIQKNSLLMTSIMRNRCHDIRLQASLRKAVHLILVLGFDSHIKDRSFGRNSHRRFSDSDMALLFTTIQQCMVQYPQQFYCTAVSEGGYNILTLGQQIDAMMKIVSQQAKSLSAQQEEYSDSTSTLSL